MKAIRFALAVAGVFVVLKSSAISLDDVPLWTGSGTNRAALVIEWNPPIILNNTTVPAPIANKTMVWGYRFNGAATGTQMFDAIVAANPQLYAVETFDSFLGTGVQAIGFDLGGIGLAGLSDGTNTIFASGFTNGILMNPNLGADSTYSLNSGDLFWSSDYFGPYWQIWTELNDEGGFTNSPNRGTNAYYDPNTYNHGQWSFASYGLDGLTLANGSWIGFSIAPDGYPDNTNDPNYSTEMAVFNNDVQAPPSPDGTYTAYVCNPDDFALQVISTNSVYTIAPYNQPAAVLGRPTLKFIDYYTPHQASDIHRAKIVEPPYWTDPETNDVITEISSGGEITVDMGRKIYDDPNNPYGVDLIVYGNSFFSASGYGGSEVNDFTDLGIATMSTGIFGHSTTVSVSQDGTNWHAFTNIAEIFPDNAYRWDDANHSWTDEQMNPTKPLNPYVYTNNFGGQTVADGLDQFIGASGGTGFDLKATGLPWIQYVRVQPGPGVYTVVDAISAVNPVAVGDALSVAPDNLATDAGTLLFQNPANTSENLITVGFDSVSAVAKVSTVRLTDFSSFAPLTGTVSSGYQITAKTVTGMNALNYTANVELRAGTHYAGNGSDLRIYQWIGGNWISCAFGFNSTNGEVVVSGVTNLSAFVVMQIVPPTLAIQSTSNGIALQFTPVANCPNIVQRSTDLISWTPIFTNIPPSGQAIALQVTNAPGISAFYRVLAQP